MSEDSPDAVLLGAYAADQSDAAFAALARRHGPMVYAVACRRTGDRHDAAGVAQAVFVALAKKCRSVDARFLPGWLMRATDFAAKARHRENARRTAREKEAAMRNARTAEAAAPPAIDPTLTDALDAALLRLGEADRSAVLSRYVHDLPFARIATESGSTDEAVRKRVARAIDRLRSELARRGVTESQLGATLAGGFAVPVPATLATALAGAATTPGAATVLAGKVAMSLSVAKWAAPIAAAFLALAVVIGGVLIGWPTPRRAVLPATQPTSAPTRVTPPAPSPPLAVATQPAGPVTFDDPPVTPGRMTETPNVSLPREPTINLAVPLDDGLTRFVAGGNLNFTEAGGTRTYTGEFYVALRPVGGRTTRGSARGDGFPVQAAAVTPDGRRAVFSMIEWGGSGHRLAVADLAGPDAGRTWPLERSTDGWIGGIAVTADGRRAATSAARTPARVDLWDLDAHAPAATLDTGRSMAVLAFDRAGRRLVACGQGYAHDDPIQIWTLADRTHRDLTGPTGRVKAVAVSADDRQLAAVTADGAVWLWDLGDLTFRWARQLPIGETAAALAFAPDGRSLAVASGAADVDEGFVRLRVFDVATGAATVRFDAVGPSVRAMAFAADGRSVVVDESSVTRKWDVPAGRTVAASPPAATRPSGLLAVLGAMPTGFNRAAAFSPEGDSVYVGRLDGGGSAWGVPGGVARPGFAVAGRVAVIRPDLDRVVTADTDENTGHVRLYALSTGKEIARLSDPALVYADAVTVSPDGSLVLIAAGTDPSRERLTFTPEISLWDVASGQRVWRNTADAKATRCVAFTADGAAVLTGGGDNAPDTEAGRALRKLDLLTGQLALTFESFGRPVVSLAPTPDGERVWACGAGGPVVAYDAGGRIVKNAGRLPTDGPFSDETPLAVSPDGRTVAAGFADSNIYLIDADSGKFVRRLTEHERTLAALAFSPDGKYLVSADDKVVRLWDTAAVRRP